MSKLTTKELYEQLQSRLVIELKENEILCPDCKGMLFVLKQEGDNGYISQCRNCHTGKLYVCRHCGKSNNTDYCDCKEFSDERHNKWELEQVEKNFKAYQKADKISYQNYTGYYILPNREYIQEIDGVRDWITEKLLDGENVPEYLWAVEPETHVSINLKDVISDMCDDGYEDMYDFLNTESELLLQAQELIDQWENEQGDNLCIFNKTYDRAVIIKDLVEEIRNELQNNK